MMNVANPILSNLLPAFGIDMNPLFSLQAFGAVLQERAVKMRDEIRDYDANELLNIGSERLVDYLFEKYSIKVPVLDEDNRSIRHFEHKLGNATDPAPPGIRYRITVPFMGDAPAFNSRPSTRVASEPPNADLESTALLFVYDQLEPDENSLKARHDQDLAAVNAYLAQLLSEVDSFNSEIRPSIAEEVRARKARLLKAHGVAASLGIRLERASLPETYAAPQVQRNTPVIRPKASTAPYMPEPTLEMAEYEHILDVIRATTLVIERNPSTFATADEPLIRDHFLVQLNGHYKGQATGETFNSHGKCDILIRADGRNIFIAEIKFWDGAQSITNALTQLVSRYTTWRDSKLALIILNRRRDFTAVLAQVPSAIEAYANTIRRIDIPDETAFRYLLKHPDDANKELLLTIMCFEVPAKSNSRATQP